METTQEEKIARAVDIAHRAMGFDEQLREQGFIRRGDVVRDTRERILSLETECYPEFVVASILETAEVLKRMLDKANFDSGRLIASRLLTATGERSGMTCKVASLQSP